MLNPTNFVGTVTALLVNRDASDLTSEPVESVEVSYAGFIGDVHSGLTRPSCVRVTRQYPKGTEIRNVRQISALSVEQIEEIRADLSINTLEPAWLGANLVVSGIPDFSELPPSSRLIADNGTSLVVDMQNSPCRFPGEIIDRHYPGQGSAFPKVAIGKRGTTLWVERPGHLAIGDRLTLHIPPPVTWSLAGR